MSAIHVAGSAVLRQRHRATQLGHQGRLALGGASVFGGDDGELRGPRTLPGVVLQPSAARSGHGGVRQRSAAEREAVVHSRRLPPGRELRRLAGACRRGRHDPRAHRRPRHCGRARDPRHHARRWSASRLHPRRSRPVALELEPALERSRCMGQHAGDDVAALESRPLDAAVGEGRAAAPDWRHRLRGRARHRAPRAEPGDADVCRGVDAGDDDGRAVGARNCSCVCHRCC